MPKLIDLTLKIEEGSVVNHPNHPRAPILWSNQRHEYTQYLYQHLWTEKNLPLFDGLPEDVRLGKDHGWASEQIIIGTHMGTHIDAPFHFENDPSQDAASIPLEQAFGDAMLLDFTKQCEGGNHAITLKELDKAESETGGKIKHGDIVILRTGHIARYATGEGADIKKYANLYSGLAYNASLWFIDRNVKLVGIDGPNVDCDMVCSAHVNFLLRKRVNKQPILIVENLANLEEITRPNFTFFAFPLPLVGGSGSPVRAVALLH